MPDGFKYLETKSTGCAVAVKNLQIEDTENIKKHQVYLYPVFSVKGLQWSEQVNTDNVLKCSVLTPASINVCLAECQMSLGSVYRVVMLPHP